jgi:hypothetical protein
VPTDLRAETVIRRPRDDVAAFASDPNHDPEWIGGIVEASLLTPTPIGNGSKVRRGAKFLGRRIDYTTEVTDWALPEAIEMEATKPFPMRIRYESAEHPEGTLASIRVRGDAKGFYSLAAPLLSRQVKSSISRDVNKLKRLLEKVTEVGADN